MRTHALKSIVERPYRVPVPNWCVAILILPPVLVIIFLMVTASRLTFIYMVAVQGLGLVLYQFFRIVKEHGWCEFEN